MKFVSQPRSPGIPDYIDHLRWGIETNYMICNTESHLPFWAYRYIWEMVNPLFKRYYYNLEHVYNYFP